jgi:hypothetical protein
MAALLFGLTDDGRLQDNNGSRRVGFFSTADANGAYLDDMAPRFIFKETIWNPAIPDRSVDKSRKAINTSIKAKPPCCRVRRFYWSFGFTIKNSYIK